MMAEKSHGSESPRGDQEKNKRDIFLSTKTAWLPRDEQLPPDAEEESQTSTIPRLEDYKQESIQQWLDSGLFVSTNENCHQVIDHTASLDEQRVVQMTVKDYMRSQHQFSETPTLSRGNSFNSCYSATSIPQSISELLEFWEKDPVEILLDLGFGADEPDICTQVPARFLSCRSAARGINIHVFLEAQKQRMDTENPNLYDRFQQLRILDHVANAFSSLLNDANVLQNEMEEKCRQKSMEKPSVNRAKEHRRRMSELHRASKQSTRGKCNIEATEIRDRDSLSSAKPTEHGVSLPAPANHCDQSNSSHSVETLYHQVHDNSDLCHTPWAPQSKQWHHTSIPVKQTSPTCVPERLAKDRSQKETSVHTKKLKNLFCRASNAPDAPDSFEMEEVLSFEEETSNPFDMTSGIVGVMVNRANSCQSDSSGFLEEPLEPPALQFLMQRLPSPSSQSPAENGCMMAEDKGPSFQDCRQESDESDSKSVASTSFSSQDWSVLEEKFSSPAVEKEPQVEAMEEPSEPWAAGMAHDETCTEGKCPRIDHHLQQPLPTSRKKNDADMSIVASKSDCSSGVLVSHSREVNDEFLRQDGDGEARAQSCHHEFQRSPGIDHPQDKCLCVNSETLEKAESSRFCPDVHKDLIPRKSPPPYIPKSKEVTSHSIEFIPTPEKSILHLDKLAADTPQRKPWCQTPGQMPPGPETEVGSFPAHADSNTDSSESITIQMPYNKPLAVQSNMAMGTDSRGAISESTLCNRAITGKPGLETAARELNDVSVQTDKCEPSLRHCCSVLSNKSLSHSAQPLTKSLSLDTGLPTICPVGICHTLPAHCHCICCHHHPNCHAEGQSPTPLACKHCLCSHDHHPEAQFLKTLKSLQETTVRELCSCTVHEMEVMKTICRSFREHLEEIEENLTRQQALFSKDMTEEEREEAEELKTLRKALRQQVEELEFQLGDRAQQIREGILLQLELLTGETEQNTNLHQYNWTEEKNGLTPCAKIHESMDSTDNFSSNDGQQATCSGGPHIASFPFSSESRSPSMSLPPLRTDSDSAHSSNYLVEEKDTDIVL